MDLPEGYQTKAGELGDTLSEGQKQRIGLARAFLYDAPILLLDEPTSSLDALSEGMILRALEAEKQERKRTIVLVSHRASTMSLADQVVEMTGRVS
jgi:ATP-binding cassette subfamily C protein